MTQRRGVATIGDSEDISTWSGIPHYLLRAGSQCGFLQRGLDLRVANMARDRRLWNLSRFLRGERPRGYQYCSSFLNNFGKKAVEECRRFKVEEVVSHYQLLPAKYLLEHCIRTSFYIDTTLQDLFATHEMLTWLNTKTAEEAIQRERAEYQSALRIVTMAHWVRASLQKTYGVSVDHIHTILPGANLPEDAVQQAFCDRGPSATPDCFTPERPLRLGFTGKDWKRKGLPRLILAVELLNRRGISAEIVVIGNLPPQYRNHCFVRAAGFIDKSKEALRFLDTVEKCDLGCAPSHEEPMGIAPLEYLRLGVPVLCTAAGGLKDVCEAAGPASILLGKDATAEEIAAELETIAKNPESLNRMRIAAWDRKEHFRWERTVSELQRLWEAPNSSAN